MGLLPDTLTWGSRRRRECRERFPRHRGLAIPTCITARAWRSCRDACRDRLLADSIQVGDGENVPGIPGARATRVSGKGPMKRVPSDTCTWHRLAVVRVLSCRPLCAKPSSGLLKPVTKGQWCGSRFHAMMSCNDTTLSCWGRNKML